MFGLDHHASLGFGPGIAYDHTPGGTKRLCSLFDGGGIGRRVDHIGTDDPGEGAVAGGVGDEAR